MLVTLILGTLHMGSDFRQVQDYQDFNPGVILTAEVSKCAPSAGGYRNSENRTSLFLGCRVQAKVAPGVYVSALAGGLTCYTAGVIPFAAPALSFGAERAQVNLTYLASPKLVGMRSGSQGLNFSATWRF